MQLSSLLKLIHPLLSNILSCTCPLGKACTDGISTEPTTCSDDHAISMDSPSEPNQSVTTPVDDNTVRCPCGCNEVSACAFPIYSIRKGINFLNISRKISRCLVICSPQAVLECCYAFPMQILAIWLKCFKVVSMSYSLPLCVSRVFFFLQ